MDWKQSEFNKRFVRLLNRRNISKTNLAIELKVKPATVTRWGSSNQNVPSLDTIQQIASKLAVDPGFLAFGDEMTTMDDEEAEIVDAWRKLTDDERAGFVTLFAAITKARAERLKTKRVTRPKKLSTEPASSLSPSQQSAIRDALDELEWIQVKHPPASEECQRAKHAESVLSDQFGHLIKPASAAASTNPPASAAGSDASTAEPLLNRDANTPHRLNT